MRRTVDRADIRPRHPTVPPPDGAAFVRWLWRDRSERRRSPECRHATGRHPAAGPGYPRSCGRRSSQSTKIVHGDQCILDFVPTTSGCRDCAVPQDLTRTRRVDRLPPCRIVVHGVGGGLEQHPPLGLHPGPKMWAANRSGWTNRFAVAGPAAGWEAVVVDVLVEYGRR